MKHKLTFLDLIKQQTPLAIVGVINPYVALMAKQIGFKALYVSGAGIANYSHGLPDLGITNLNDVVTDVKRITAITDLPVLVDCDTGWGNAFNIARTVKEMIAAGAAGLHLEDQVQAKRCGHRPGKTIVSKEEMSDRIKAAVDARTDDGFIIMARTDALAVEGIDSAIERASACVAAGADMIFAEAMTTLDEYKQFTAAINVPVLANITEFGKTPIFNNDELAKVGVAMVLYPLSAARAMQKAAHTVLKTIYEKGSQENAIDLMQTRDELYDILDYYHYEQILDKLQGASDE